MPQSMEQELEEYIRYIDVEKNLAPRTIHEYRTDLTLLIRFLKDERNCSSWNEVTYKDLRHYLYFLQNERKNSAKTRSRSISSVRGLFSFLFEEELIEKNPSLRLKKPKLEQKLPFFLSQDECELFLDSIKQGSRQPIRDLTIVYLFLFTGIRMSELTQLDVHDINWGNQSIRVYGKGRKERVIPILSPLAAQLHLYLDYREKKLGEMASSFSPLFFAMREKNVFRIHRRTVHDIFKKHAQLARLDQRHFTAHKLRHTFATFLYAQGVNLIELKSLLGHANINTTEIYTHLSTHQLIDAVNKHPMAKIKFKE